VFRDTYAKLQEKHENEQQKKGQPKKSSGDSVKRKRQDEDGGEALQEGPSLEGGFDGRQQLKGDKSPAPQQPTSTSKASDAPSSPTRVFQALIPGLADGCVSAAVGWLSQQLVGHPFLYMKADRLYLQAAHMKHKVLEWAAAEAQQRQQKQQRRAA
jgi:hypothetical protein